MAKKTTRQMSLHEMAVRLCEGGEVFFMGYWLKAKELPNDVFPCEECKMDCICHLGEPLCDLCHECDEYTNTPHLLYFACER